MPSRAFRRMKMRVDSTVRGMRTPCTAPTLVLVAASVLAAASTATQAAQPNLNPPRPGAEYFPASPNANRARPPAPGQPEPVVYPSEPFICPPMNDVALPVSVPKLCPGFEFRAGVLYLQPSADNLGYAVLTNEQNFSSPYPLAQPFWDVQTLTPTYKPGFEFGGRYAFADTGNDVQVNWQHLRTTTSEWASTSLPVGQWISPFSQTGPSTAESLSDLNSNQGVNKLLTAAGQVKFAYDMVDIDFGQYVNVGSSLQFRLFGGISYARLQERLYSSFYGAPPDPHAPFPLSVPILLSLNNSTIFNGAGPRFGLDTTYNLPRGFRLTGRVAGAALIGRSKPAQYVLTATSPELAGLGIPVNREFISSTAFTQVVYAFNAKLGAGYTYVFSNGWTANIEAGYMAALFIKPFSSYETNNNVLPLQIGSLSTASMRHTLSDFTLNGLYSSASLKW